MASPQKENGHLRVATELAHALALIELSSSESKIVWVIMIKTYGWNKKMDYISVSQFQELSGLPRRSVFRTIKSLEIRNIITIDRSNHVSAYGIQKNYEKWASSYGVNSDTIIDGDNIDTEMVTAVAQNGDNAMRSAGVNSDTHNNKTINKNNARTRADSFNSINSLKAEIKNFKQIGWSTEQIKKHFFMRNIPEVDIVNAFKMYENEHPTKSNWKTKPGALF